ncbi:MAG: ATP-binding protein [Acidimicrobiales bacterium]|nr:ATP-binding protein [Acidimicrobiales bacterium]
MTPERLNERIAAQRALEALRNGVPNGDAVRALGCMQPEVIDRFRGLLEALSDGDLEGDPPVVPGMLIAGDFGTGKSHTLAWLEQDALDRNFVVSRIVISKETPLYDPAKLFLVAVRDARLRDARGSLLHELALRTDFKSPTMNSFVDWALRKQPYGMLAASVLIYERSQDLELREEIVNWWSGDKLAVARVRAALKELGIPKAFDVSAVRLADLAPVRFEFAARLARAVGCGGWVLLFDEAELVARYSLLQRGKAYAELARWLGVVPGQSIPGVTAVAAITDDYDINVLDGRRDREKVPERLKARGDESALLQAMMAERGMDLIGHDALRLHAPNDDTLRASFEKVRSLYRTAYDYEPRSQASFAGSRHQAMRSYVRRWISDWDLERLYPGRLREAEEEVLRTDYSEDPELLRESEERSGDH